MHTLELAFIYSHQLYLDYKAKLYFIKVDEAKPMFLFAASIGTSVVAFGATADANIQYAIDVQE